MYILNGSSHLHRETSALILIFCMLELRTDPNRMQTVPPLYESIHLPKQHQINYVARAEQNLGEETDRTGWARTESSVKRLLLLRILLGDAMVY